MLDVAGIFRKHLIDIARNTFNILNGAAHSVLRFLVADNGIDILHHIVDIIQKLVGIIHNVVHRLGLIAGQRTAVGKQMTRILSGRDGNELFTQEAVRRDNGFRILGNLCIFFQKKSHFNTVFTGRYRFHLTDVNADIADGIPRLKSVGIRKSNVHGHTGRAE